MNIIEPKTVELRGLHWRWRYEHRDFAEAEGRLRITLTGPDGSDFWKSGLPSHMLGVLLYVGLLNREKALLAELYPPPEDSKQRRGWSPPSQLTLDDVRGLINYENAPQIEVTVMEAIDNTFPRPKDEENEPKAEAPEPNPLAETSTGSDSGAFPASSSESQNASSGA